MFHTKFEDRIKTHFLCSIILGNLGQIRQAKDDNILSRIHIACWILQATNTHSEYVIMFAFPLLKLLYKHSSILRYALFACLVLHTIQYNLNSHSAALLYNFTSNHISSTFLNLFCHIYWIQKIFYLLIPVHLFL